MSPQEPRPGDRVADDPAMADEEVVPAPAEDKDQGRDNQDEPKEAPQRGQIFPNS
jgi:hypothetical protein